MSAFHYAPGLDISIGSVGWVVPQNDLNGEPVRVQDLGVRIFDKAKQSKTGASLALPRHEARGARRRLRRHQLERIRYLSERAGVMPIQEIEGMYAAKGGFPNSPYQLRTEAPDYHLAKEDAVRVLVPSCPAPRNKEKRLKSYDFRRFLELVV